MFVPILPLFNEKYRIKFNFEIATSDYFYTPKYEYSEYNMCDGDKNTAWASSTFKKAHAKFQFPAEYTPQKISMTSSSDTSKSPKSFRLYGVPDDTLNLMNTFGLKQVDEEPTWIGCTLLLDIKNETWKEHEKKEWTFKNDKKYRMLVLYMYEKQGDWNGKSEYSIAEFQCYEYMENERSLIKRKFDGKHVAVTKRVKNPFVGFSFDDINENRNRFKLLQNRSLASIHGIFRLYLVRGGYILFGDDYYGGKLYMEFTKYNDLDLSIGLVAKHTDDYGAWGVNNLLFNFYAKNLYFYGAEKIGEKTVISSSLVGGVRRIGIAMDLDNNIFEAIVDGKSMGKVKVRELPKPVIPIIRCGGSSSFEVDLQAEAKYMPKGFKNIISKREYEYVVAELTENVSAIDYAKYGMQKGQKIEFDKPYNKEFVWSKKDEALGEGKVFSYQFKAKENVQKIKLDEVK
ncbi:hypothetical protein [Paenibacillus alvei]|uniref:Uncharacterized protein n=1 Tax=Paenibacillus alvei TaxID=44250 RepID=A0AAP7A461_PAEAL|nr:hypothetical protein [Paenibacillus alvei]NOJ73925.1 hypothetical protein [Paenibacillus alvei]